MCEICVVNILLWICTDACFHKLHRYVSNIYKYAFIQKHWSCSFGLSLIVILFKLQSYFPAFIHIIMCVLMCVHSLDIFTNEGGIGKASYWNGKTMRFGHSRRVMYWGSNDLYLKVGQVSLSAGWNHLQMCNTGQGHFVPF